MSTAIYIGYLAALLLAGLSILLWRRATSLHHLLQEAANRFEEGRRLNTQLTEQHTRLESDLKDMRQALRKSDTQIADLKSKNHILVHELKNTATSQDEEKRQLTNHMEILTHERHVLTQQLKDMDQEKAQLQRELNQLQKQFDKKIAETTSAKDQKIQEKEQALTTLRQELQVLKTAHNAEAVAELKEKNIELHKLRRKLNQQQHILTGMRGLKEMQEERLHNWEVALRLLAANVLDISPESTHKKAIGEIVGQALEKIGGELMADDIENPLVSHTDTSALKSTSELS